MNIWTCRSNLLHTAVTFHHFSLFHSELKTYLFRKSYPTPQSVSVCQIDLMAIINQSIIILSERMQKHCSHCTSILRAGKWQWKKVSFKFLFKCRQCHWWRHFWRKTVPDVCSRNTERSITDCLKTCLWHSKSRWWRRTQTLSTWKIGDMAQAVTEIRRGKTPQTPKCQYCQLERYSLWCTKPVQPVK